MPGQFSVGNNKAAKLTGEQVIEIRERYATERGLSQPMLAREYGVSVNTIGKVLNGTSWQWLLRGQEPQVYRPPIAARGPELPSVEEMHARMRARLEAEVVELPEPRIFKGLSLYDSPPPTEAEDREIAERGLGRLNNELDKLGQQPRVEDELGKLEKGD